MNFARLILSNKGILMVTVCLLGIASTFAFEGVMMEASSPLAELPVLTTSGNSISSYVMAGVMGKIPSTAGTLQSIGLFLGYIVTPFVVAIMLALQTSLMAADTCLAADDLDDPHLVEDPDTAYAA